MANLYNPDTIQQTYDTISSLYATYTAPLTESRAHKIVDQLKGEIQDGQTFINFGAGVGIFDAEIRRVAPNSKLVVVDISTGMLSQLQLRFKDDDNIHILHGHIMHSGMLDHTRAILADAGFPTQFDWLILDNVLSHIPESQHASLLQKLTGFGVPGGRFLFSRHHEEQIRSSLTLLRVDPRVPRPPIGFYGVICPRSLFRVAQTHTNQLLATMPNVLELIRHINDNTLQPTVEEIDGVIATKQDIRVLQSLVVPGVEGNNSISGQAYTDGCSDISIAAVEARAKQMAGWDDLDADAVSAQWSLVDTLTLCRIVEGL